MYGPKRSEPANAREQSEIQLLIASCDIGIGAELTARLNFELGADVKTPKLDQAAIAAKAAAEKAKADAAKVAAAKPGDAAKLDPDGKPVDKTDVKPTGPIGTRVSLAVLDETHKLYISSLTR